MHISPHSKKVIAAVIHKDGKVLIAQRAKNDALKGLWEFPGGKLEEGETFEQCLKRELLEELSIVAEVGSYLCTSPFYHKNTFMEMIVFHVTSFTGNIQVNEHQTIKWVLPKELSHFAFPEPDLLIIKILVATTKT